MKYMVNVSIHAPARGATKRRCDSSRRCWFQSTRPRGARLRVQSAEFYRIVVSIHAPARGATCASLEYLLDFGVSIHAPARGATFLHGKRGTGKTFQSTRPRGARLRVRRIRFCIGAFQSTRPRGARRRQARRERAPTAVSIHAPARGATPSSMPTDPDRRVSIHAPARGATPPRRLGVSRVFGFNPRAREGRDP